MAYVVQEAIVVIKDVFRKYPNKYESVIATLCENLESLEEPEVVRAPAAYTRHACACWHTSFTLSMCECELC